MGCLVLFSAWGYANSFGAYQAYYPEMLTESATTISWIGSIQVFLSLTVGAFSGRLLDAGYFSFTYLVGMAIQVTGIFLMSISTRYWQLVLTQGVLSGLGAGIYFTPAISIVNTYFTRRRSLAVGLATTGNSLGGIVYPLIVRHLIPKLGFGWATRVIAFLNFGLLTIAFIFMHPRLAPRKSGPLLELGAFKEMKYAGFLIPTFLLFWSYYYTFYYIGSYGTEVLNLPASSAPIFVVIINAAGLPFRVFTPLVADRIGHFNVIIPVTFIWSIVGFAWLAVHDVPSYYAFTAVYGIISAAFQCLFPSTVASITPELNTLGTRLGMAFTVSAIASLTGPPLGGVIQSKSGGGFETPIIWAASVTVAAFLMLASLRLYIGGFKLKKC
ncbi:major facilitator superfamily domain-containing protein [Xylaria sp. CBS 124048]|nr:major facilitator superfamily domain-containing protein [Xylaria sp. CBS 124048]